MKKNNFWGYLLLFVVMVGGYAYNYYFESKNSNQVYSKPTKSTDDSISHSDNGYVLAISWQNAFCETMNTRECRQMKRDDYAASNFVLHGLWPQTGEDEYCNVSKEDVHKDKTHKWLEVSDIGLDVQTKRDLPQYMPGFVSGLHNHEWLKHGSCSGYKSDEFFDTSIAMVKQVNASKLQKLFVQNIGKQLKYEQIAYAANMSFGEGASRKMMVVCKNNMIAEIRFSLSSYKGSLAEAIKSGDSIAKGCRIGLVDGYN